MTVRIGVLASGGDAPGMNAAIRAVVRAGITAGAEVHGIRDGWQGAIDGGGRIRRLAWDDVAGIAAAPGTVLGTSRCAAFFAPEGRRTAVASLVRSGIDRLVVIGGDGSLTGARLLLEEWPEHLAALVADGRLTPAESDAHPRLVVAGIVGSIDNDMVGTDMTIGADSALHRIVEAIDAIASTAAFKDRNFVIEVMGRDCGYLALMSAIAGGADYLIVPEQPLRPDWRTHMAGVLHRARAAGRRTSVVVVAEGARDTAGNPVTSEQVRRAVAEEMGEDARITILGHVQRGGRPSAFDRWMAALVGHAATAEVLRADREPQLIGVRANRPSAMPLADAVAATGSVRPLITEGRYDEAMAVRGHSFVQMHQAFLGLSEAPTAARTARRRIGILHCGGVAPGMNAAAQAFVRLGLDRGHEVVGVRGGFPGLLRGEVRPLGWPDIEGWVRDSGSHLGTRRTVPGAEDLEGLAAAIVAHGLDALVVIGGLNAYRAVDLLDAERARHPAFALPVVVVPCSVDNNCPGLQMAIGADTALNVAVQAVDRIKRSATLDPRAFVVEVTGRNCDFLALTAGVAAGAERVYLNEEGISLGMLAADIARMRADFADGQELWLALRNEEASAIYTVDLLTRMFEAESQGAFSVRGAVLGHIQQGGAPSPFDRITSVRLASGAMAWLDAELDAGGSAHVFATPDGTRPVSELADLVDLAAGRLRAPWWTALHGVLDDLGHRPVPAGPPPPASA